ncbi:hypothetical protein ACFQZ4_36015 [Catellatospora coxensis]
MTARHRIAVLALDGVMALDLGIPSQVFGCAADSAGHRLYETRVCTPTAARSAPAQASPCSPTTVWTCSTGPTP